MRLLDAICQKYPLFMQEGGKKGVAYKEPLIRLLKRT